MEWLVTVHSIWRWVVLLAALWAVVGGLAGRSGGAARLAGVGRFYAVFLDIQVLIGIILWISEARWQSGLFFAVIHPVTMLLALGVAHMGAAIGKKGRAAWPYYLASLALIAAGIPASAW